MDILRGLLAYAISTATGRGVALTANASDELLVALGSSITQDINLIEVAGNAVATTAISGTVPGEGTSADGAAHDGSYPTNVAGLVSATDPTYLAAEKAELSITLDGRVRTNNDIEQVGGSDVAATAIAGTFPGEGTSADADPHDGSNPINIAGLVAAADPTYIAADKAELSITLDGRVRTNNDIEQVGGSAVATGGITGTFIAEGTTADGTTVDTSNPIKMGAVSEEIPAGSGVIDDEQVHFITDLLRRLWTRSAAFNSLTNADQVENLNTIATDMDHVPQIDAEESNLAMATYYYPSAAGREIGTRKYLGFALTLQDITSCALEVPAADGTNWVDITPSLIDKATGLTGYAATDFTSGIGVTSHFYVEPEYGINANTYRWAVVVPNNSEDHTITKVGRAV